MQKILDVDMDNVLVDFESGIAHLPEATREAHPDWGAVVAYLRTRAA